MARLASALEWYLERTDRFFNDPGALEQYVAEKIAAMLEPVLLPVLAAVYRLQMRYARYRQAAKGSREYHQDQGFGRKGFIGSPLQEPDYYARLNVARNADITAIKRAFRKLALQCHPDHNPNDGQAEQRFKQINEAYSVLKDPQQRAAYDYQWSCR